MPWTAILFLLAAALPPIARVLAGPPGAIVHVRWQASIGESDRRSAEARFQLTSGEPLEQNTWRYDLADSSAQNVRALVAAPAVADTQNIDRSTGAIAATAARTARRSRYPAWGDRIVALSDRLAVTALLVAALGALGRRKWPQLAKGARRRAAETWQRIRWMCEPPPRTPTRVMDAESTGDHLPRWTVAVLAVSAPLAVMLVLTLWYTPYPLTEAVALFEDAADRPPLRFFIPDRTYYRPVYQALLSVIWHSNWSLTTMLTSIKLLSIVPMALLILLLVWYCRPRSAIEALAALVAVVVLVGSPGFRDNLELPLCYMIVGMAGALIAWVLLNREPRVWHEPVVLAMTLVAIGFKEQGLALIPVVIVAWWTRAPSASGRLAAVHAALAIGYVGLRLMYRQTWWAFEQDIGIGFTAFDVADANVRFAARPFWIYAYTSASTTLNILFSEPTRGVYRFVDAWLSGRMELWQYNHLLSSTALTGLIAWWGLGSLGRHGNDRWTTESRVFVACLAAVAASGALSFNYSRDRLGGMATVFYALATYLAFRKALTRTWNTSGWRFAIAGMACALLAVAWQARALGTLQSARQMAQINRAQWVTLLPERRVEFAHRRIYLRIMESMVEQGVRTEAPHPTPYPRWVARALGPS